MTRTLALAAVLLSGCAASRLPANPPATLAEVNVALDGRDARIQTIDGREYAAERVVLDETRTTFALRDTGDTLSVPTDSLDHVSVLARTSALGRIGRGTLIGAAPGLVVTGLGVGLALVDVSDGDYAPSLAAIFITAGGVALAVIGTVVGAAGGAASDPERWHVVYRRPLTADIDPIP